MTLPTPFSYVRWTGDGSETSFTFTWDYIYKDHVHVYLGDTEVAQGTGADQWQWDGDKKIEMGTAPADGVILTIRRQTPLDGQIVDWQDGSHLISLDLNTSDLQWLYLIQEWVDQLLLIANGEPPIPGPGIPIPALAFWNRLFRGDDPNVGTENESAQTIAQEDQLKARATEAVQNGVDAYVLTLGALQARYDVLMGDGASYPGTGNTGQVGKFRIDGGRLFFWNGSSWIAIGGGGGGGGDLTGVQAGPGILVANPDGPIPKISADVGDGLSLGTGDSDKITINVASGGGLTVNGNGLSVTVPFVEPPDDNVVYGRKTNGGVSSWVDIAAEVGDITEVQGGPGITVTNGTGPIPKASVALEADADRVGLELNGTGDAQILRGKIAGTSTLGVVMAGAGLAINADGVLTTNLASPLRFIGNLNVVTGTPDAEPADPQAGDAFTAVPAGTIAGDADTTDWNTLLRDPHGATVDVGDLIVCNTDGGGENAWTLVPVGGINFWTRTGSELSPDNNDDVVRLNSLANDGTTGTGVVLADDDGRLVRSAAGNGLKIENGVIQIDPADINLDGFVKTEDGGTQQSIWSSGLLLTDGPTDARVTGYDLGYAATNSPRFKINAGGTGAAARMQISTGDENGVGSRGVFITAGDTNNTKGKIVVKGQSGGGSWLDFTNGDGETAETRFMAWQDGSVDLTGSLGFKSAARQGFTLKLNAVPITSYAINFPANHPTANNQVLRVVDHSVNPRALEWAAVSWNDVADKPTIPDAQVQSNWTETDNTSAAFIQNKPNIPGEAPVQSVDTRTGNVDLSDRYVPMNISTLTELPG